VDSRVAWVLNLDADFELALGAGYAPTKSVQDAVKHHARALIGTLTREGDLVVDGETPSGSARGLVGRAFCPTPRAIALLEHAGAEPEPHPTVDVLRRVNARAFCQSLGTTMPDGSFETDLESALAKLARDPVIGSGWRVKRSHGVAGRGQRLVRPGEDASFLRSWIEEGGAQIEPNVNVISEVSMHAMLSTEGALAEGPLVAQTCDAAGAWLASAVAFDADWRRAALQGQIKLVSGALHAAGYFGPFGVDAFEYREKGELRFQPRSEINARYSMGFALR
jgi:ATP-grasp domain